ncbi:MAG: adenosylcobinamide-GDP ribazoletransferase [Paracoccaceae bacterium]|nr:adenosylcobinamide-GDP ribazoletransferase [Paracoccaceae bacterium]
MTSRNEFNIAMQFLTRLPIGGEVEHSDESFARSARFYPAVGLVVGAIAAAVYFAADVFLPNNVSAFLALLAGVAVTGGLHEDGLADAADGLIGGRDRDHSLDIMRDSQIGVFGVLALIFALALNWSVLMAWSDWEVLIGLIAAHAISRHMMTEVIGRYDYARSDNAKFSTPDLGTEDQTFARLWTLAVIIASVFFVGLWATVIGIGVAAALTSGFAQYFSRKLGGFTGDCLGATQQIAMTGFLVGTLVWG